MANEETIRNAYGQPIAIYEYSPNGDMKVIDWHTRKILGYYYKSRNVTTDFYGRVLYYGNVLGKLIKD